MSDDKIWFLAAGKKKVGPLSLDQVVQRHQAGKLPSKTKAWKDGLDGRLPVSEIPELQDAFQPAAPQGDEAEEAPVADVEPVEADSEDAEPEEDAEAPAEKAGARKKKISRSRPRPGGRPGRGKGAAGAKKGAGRRAGASASASAGPGGLGAKLGLGFLFPEAVPLGFDQPYRIEKKDIWRGFGLGLDRSRVIVLLLGSFATFALALVLGGVGSILGMAHWSLMVPFLILTMLGAAAITGMAMGALAYQLRLNLLGEEQPGVKGLLRFAWEHRVALGFTPVLVSISVLIPVIVLVLLSLLLKIPYFGPIFTGLIYGVHIALGAATLFLGLAAALAGAFCPIIVAFEETTLKETVQVLFDFVKRSAARSVIWGFWPSVVYTWVFSTLVATIVALILLTPIAINATVGGAMELLMPGQTDRPRPYDPYEFQPGRPFGALPADGGETFVWDGSTLKPARQGG